MKYDRRLVCIVLLLLFMIMAGCGSQSSGKIGDRPPAFTLPDMQGGQVSLKGQEGKLVVVYFWSDSCACAKKLPLLNGYYGANKAKGLEILAVNAGQPRSAVEEYLKTNGLTYPILLDTDMKTAKQFGVTGLPTVYIVDRQGMIRQKLIGEIEMDVLMKLLTKLL